MKRKLALLLVSLMVAGLAACGQVKEDKTKLSGDSEVKAATEQAPESVTITIKWKQGENRDYCSL